MNDTCATTPDGAGVASSPGAGTGRENTVDGSTVVPADIIAGYVLADARGIVRTIQSAIQQCDDLEARVGHDSILGSALFAAGQKLAAAWESIDLVQER